jgi:hypothetical protein
MGLAQLHEQALRGPGHRLGGDLESIHQIEHQPYHQHGDDRTPEPVGVHHRQ